MPFPVDIKYIHEAEAKLGVKFPAAFVVKMTKRNGGSLKMGSDRWELFPFMDSSDRKRLSRTCNDIVRETKNSNDWPDFPPNAVAIGANNSGDKLILVPQEESPRHLSHEIFWWDHETGEVHFVADDFSDLCEDE